MPASDFSELCLQTIVWEQMTGRDAYAKPTYAAPVTFAPPLGGRRVFDVVRKSSAGTGPAGSGVEFVSGSYIWILATPGIGLEDRVYVQGDTIFPPVLTVKSYPDETGAPFYVKVTLGSFNG
jgi:hypothetical protein